MNTKPLIWSIIVIFLIIIASIVFLSVYKKPVEEKPDSAKIQCEFFCETGQKNGFCSFEINADKNLRTTCEELSKNSQYSRYNVQLCSSISCEPAVQESDKTCVSGLNSVWANPNSEGKCPVQENKFVIKRTDNSDAPPVEGQICCYYYE